MAVNIYEKPLLTQKRITPWTLPEDTIDKSLSAQQANYDKNRDAFMSVLDNIQQYKARPHVKGDMDYITNVYNEYKNRISSQLDQYGQNYGMLSPEMLIRATDEVLMPHKEQITGIAQNYYYWELEQKMDAEMRASGKDPLFRSEELQLKPTVDDKGNVSVYPSTIEHRQDWDEAQEGYFEPIGSWLESRLGANPETVINSAGGWQQFYSTLHQDNKIRLDAVINGGVESYIKENPQEFRSRVLDHTKAGKTPQEAQQAARQEIRNSFIWRGAKRRIEVIKEDVEIKSIPGTGGGGKSSGSNKEEEDEFRPSSPATTNYTVEGLTIYDPKTPLEEQVQIFYKPFSIFTHNQDASFFDGSNSISNLNNIEAGKWKGISVGTGQKSTSAGATNLGVDTSGILQMLGNTGTYTVNGKTVNPVLSTISVDQLPQYITHLEDNVLNRKLTEQEIATIRSNQLTPDNDKLLTVSALEPAYNMETGEYETVISPFLQENSLLDQPAIDNLNKFMSNQKQSILAYNIEMTTMHKKAERLGNLEADLRQQYGWTKREEEDYVKRQLNNASDIDKVNYLPQIGADLPRDFRRQIDPNKMLVEMSMNPTRAFIKAQAISEINTAISKEGKYYAKNGQFSKLMSNHEDGRELYGEPIYNWLKNQFGAETVKSMMANNINGMGQIFSEIDTSTDVGKMKFNDYHAQGRILENPNKPGKYLYLNQEIYDFMESIPEEILLDNDQANQLKSYKPKLSEEEKKKRVPLIKASNPKYRNYITASNQLAEPYNIEGYIFAFGNDYQNNNAIEARMMKYIMAANDDKIRRKQWDTTEAGKRKVTDKYNYQSEFTKSLDAHPEWGKKEDLAAKSMISLTGVRYDLNDGFVLDFGFIDSEGARQDLEYHGVEFVPQDLNDIGMIPSSAPNVMETLKQIEQTLEQNNNISGHVGTGHTKMPFFVTLTDDNTGLGRFKKGHFYTYDVNASNPADSRVYHKTISDLHDYYISSHKDYYGPLIELMKAKELFVQHPDVARMAYPQLWMKFQDENAILQNLDQSIRDLQDTKYTSQKTQDIRKNINISPEQKDLISKGEVGLAAKNANLFNIKDPTAKKDERGVAIPDSSNLFYSNGKLGVTQLGVDDEGHAIFSDPDQGALAGIQFLLKYYTAGTLKGTNTAYGKLPENAYDESGKIKLKAFRNKYATSQNGDTLIQKLRSNNVLDVNGQQITDDTLLEDVEFDQIAYYFAVLEDANLINHLGGKNYIDQLIKKYKTLMD